MNRKERRKNKSLDKSLDLQNDFLIAFNLHKEGNTDKAKSLYDKILIKEPGHFDTLRHLGIIFQDIHQLDKALTYFKKAQTINPNSHEIYNNLGSIMFQKFKQIEAKKFYEESLKIKPNYLPALNNLTLLCHRLGYAEEALRLSTSALQIQEGNIMARTNYALALSINGRLNEAIEIFKDIINLNPNGANLKNLGTAYRDTGELKKSHDFFIKALDESPEDESIFFNLSASKLYSPKQETLNHFKDILKSPNKLDNNQKTAIGFALYNSYHKLKNYEKAGIFLELGNEYSDNWIQSDLKKEKYFINEVKNLFSEEFLKQKSIKKDLQNNLDTNPIFILGMPRSGTTLCEQILCSHSKVIGAGELPEIIRYSGAHSAYNLNEEKIRKFKKHIKAIDLSTLEKNANDYLMKLKNIGNKNKYITDKMPHNFVMIGYIKMILPNAKIIYCKRDPMDNCFSLYSHKFVDMNHGYCYNQKNLGEYYNLHNDLMKHWISIFKKDIFTLEHEKLIESQEKTSREMIEFCGLKWEDACLEFYKTQRQVQTASNEQVREPINKRSLAAWKKYEKLLGPLKKSLNYS